ncbi:SAM-dependent methyltransferase [Gracilinema caldarium]|uniref:Fmu (Sun) domain protein n=1 Tax=Gracilinema caldarium (strain ATCC 51460 / DSM 7334 / H1) TaxID=744872 RepID=F8EZB4_GRAC1|nr:SAM-dependent methyltransferase [Gracilinema caldarium]AEJ19706.1 Fmu (Sun) domain protein [Gracilinema caldarium DSM 7334]
MSNAEFDAYYTSIFGNRWGSLRALLIETNQAIAYNEGLQEPYFMDRASVLAAQSLRIPEEGELLDACAAPGGKSLVIASRMGTEVRLLSNELSSDRRRRLVDVLNHHLPPSLRERVTVSGFDAAALARRETERGRFRAILLDAPCSSERHVIADPKALAQWTRNRPRSLSQRQWALLSSAFLLLAPGGSLVYATCALSPEENDEVVRRLMKKYGPQLTLDRPDFTEGEETEFGKHILPDTTGGMGPMYVARFIKLE